MFTYYTSGTCSRTIIFEVDGQNKLHGVKFIRSEEHTSELQSQR